MSDIYNSKLAKILRWFHGTQRYAITTSKDCCRYSCSQLEVDIRWEKHENTHKKQFAEFGWFKFLFLYIIETIKHGYTNNKFEIEARKESQKK